jgi:hypothetical protein
MPHDYLHTHKDFPDLLRIVSRETGVPLPLVEKDYWIMHCLYGLQQCGFQFELKGGTSLSKGWGIIERFSEDIDIRIEPPKGMAVSAGKNQDKPAHVESRHKYYDWLSSTISINGIHTVQRDAEYNDVKYRSGGIRLRYKEITDEKVPLKDGVLLEVGFDIVTPNRPIDISSWAYDYAAGKVPVIDNRALAVKCYEPGYTLVEKLHAISKKYRLQQETGLFPVNFIRHYYDVYSLLGNPVVQSFIGTAEYLAHKNSRFGTQNQNLAENPAFTLADTATFKAYQDAYEKGLVLYYRDRPSFSDIMKRIREYAAKL